MADKIKFTLDGKTVITEPGETIWQVAKRVGTEIPHLCYAPEPGYRPDGNCRACMVEIEGERVLSASCIRKPNAGMKVITASKRAKKAREMVFELLVADQPDRTKHHDYDSRFWQWAEDVGVDSSRFPKKEMPSADSSHPAMAVNLDACINCTLCVRACRDGGRDAEGRQEGAHGLAWYKKSSGRLSLYCGRKIIFTCSPYPGPSNTLNAK